MLLLEINFILSYLILSTGTVVQTKPEGWRDAVQNTTSTSYCMSLTFHNKVGLTDNMMHGIDPYLY